ncbi:MAG TPA: histidinol-phosphatase HisJ family protein [Bacteroidetes bacterium]|nr:histidinol-phosphatase HisJ family protein [Bacteroidota bacterium]
MIDYHIHTSLSDGSGEHREYYNEALRLGLSEMGFSDHFCLRPVPWAMGLDDLPAWKKRMQQVRKECSGSCRVKTGLEVDYFPEREEELKAVLDGLPLDYVIGSVHFLGTWNFDSSLDGYDEWDLRHLYEYYYNLVTKAAESGLFDVIGHLDLVKKFGHRLADGLEKIITKTLEAISKAGLAVELNTSGRNKPCRDFYPSYTLLEQCYQFDIPVTLGSDAHNPGDVGQYFPDAIDMLKKIGYTRIAVFEKRQIGFIPF